MLNRFLLNRVLLKRVLLKRVLLKRVLLKRVLLNQALLNEVEHCLPMACPDYGCGRQSACTATMAASSVATWPAVRVFRE